MIIHSIISRWYMLRLSKYAYSVLTWMQKVKGMVKQPLYNYLTLLVEQVKVESMTFGLPNRCSEGGMGAVLRRPAMKLLYL